jgi:hypothetical protein
MVWLVLAVLVPVVAGAIFSHRYIDETFFGVMLGVIPGILAVFAVAALLNGDPREADFSFDVVATRDGSTTEGSFFIFSGTVNEEFVYQFYRQDCDSCPISHGYIPADHTVIYEDQETRGFIRVIKEESWFKAWSFGLADDPTFYEIHVPAGSVVRTHEFDLE